MNIHTESNIYIYIVFTTNDVIIMLSKIYILSILYSVYDYLYR